MMEILNMTADHVAQVAALEAICFHDPWSEKSVASELTNPLSLWLVALDGDRVAGYVGSQSVLGESDMMNVAVHPDYRRRGIAGALTSRLSIEILNRGKVPFYCAAWCNLISVRNAIRCGFRPAWVTITAREKAFVDKMNG